MNITSDYDDGGIKIWVEGVLVFHANQTIGSNVVKYLRDEWGVTAEKEGHDNSEFPEEFFSAMEKLIDAVENTDFDFDKVKKTYKIA